jgi:ribosomal-protein-alanine N-acetyltransferase
MIIKIRKMDLSDIRYVFEEEVKIFGKSLGEKTLYNEIMYNDLSYYYIAIVDGQRAGYIGSWLTIPNAEILNMFVSKKYRGMGIGYSLMEQIIEICNDQDIENLTLEVRKSNDYALKLYGSLGFINAAVRKKYYGDGEDALLMVKKLGVLS